jgi:hypothetical protein
LFVVGDRLKSASKHRKQENHNGENQVYSFCFSCENNKIFCVNIIRLKHNKLIVFQLAEQRRRLGGGEDSTYNVRDFLDDSASEVSEMIRYNVD